MSRTTVPKPPHGSLEWLRIRHRDEVGLPVVSASEAAAVHGMHRFKSKYGLAMEKIADEPEVTETTRAMDRGNRLEPVIIDWASDDLGIDLVSPDLMYQYQGGFASMVATLDAINAVGPAAHPEIVVEIKTYNREWSPANMPPYWWFQGVHQAVCAGVDVIHWAIFDSTLDLHIHEQHVGEDDKELHIAAVGEFCKQVSVGVIPEDWQATYAEVAAHAPANEGAIELDEHIQLIDSLREVQAEKKQLNDREDELKARLGIVLDGRESGTIDGREVVTWKHRSRTSFDAKRFAAEQPDLHHQYQTSSSYRVMNIKGGSK
jgi:predicted phage-related endonuclease